MLEQKAMGETGFILVALSYKKIDLALICAPFNLFLTNYVYVKCIFTVAFSLQ